MKYYLIIFKIINTNILEKVLIKILKSINQIEIFTIKLI